MNNFNYTINQMKWIILLTLFTTLFSNAFGSEPLNNKLSKKQIELLGPFLKQHQEASTQKDTSALLNILNNINSQPNPPKQFVFQAAELKYTLWGETKEILRAVKKYPDYFKGRQVLIQHFLVTGNYKKLKYFQQFMISNVLQYPHFVRPLYLSYKSNQQTKKGHFILFNLVNKNKEYRTLFYKIYSLAKDQNSPYLYQILELGFKSYRNDVKLALKFAETIQSADSTLDIYKFIYYRNKNNLEVLKKGGAFAIATDNYHKSIPYLKKWSQLEPQNITPVAMLHQAYSQLNSMDEIKKILPRLIKEQGLKLPYVISQFKIDTEGRDLPKTLKYCSQLLNQYPFNGQIQKLTVDAIRKFNAPQKLTNTLVNIESLDPTAHHIQYLLAKSLLKKKKTDKALIYLDKAIHTAPQNNQYQDLLSSILSSEKTKEESYSYLTKENIKYE